MTTATFDRTAGGNDVIDVRVLEFDGTVHGACDRLQQPCAWTEWRCPACGELYRDPAVICTGDAAPLEAVVVSMPFLWLG